MRKLRVVLATVVATVFLNACVGYPALREGNREKIAQLQLGMTKSQVEVIMGNSGFMDVKQPYRREVFESNGRAYEVLYYYTDFIQNFQPMDTGMTPVVFREGRFIGAGRDYLFKVR